MRKYRVMIIDDEMAARKLMRASINWESLGMEVVGEAASGIEAINVIDEMKPDIAFVDISMPFMNGIEFTEVATARYPKLVIIIMTAFDQFEYARKCVRLPVFEYMLKPMVRSEVTSVLESVKRKLDETLDLDGESVSEGTATQELEPNAIAQIKKYIESDYVDSKINLASVAEKFGFSASYLSRRFKQETGKNFVEYLTECRMEKAMKLAEQGKKMFLASAEVGIPDPNYFGRCFKKYAGMSYSEYVAEHTK